MFEQKYQKFKKIFNFRKKGTKLENFQKVYKFIMSIGKSILKLIFTTILIFLKIQQNFQQFSKFKK